MQNQNGDKGDNENIVNPEIVEEYEKQLKDLNDALSDYKTKIQRSEEIITNLENEKKDLLGSFPDKESYDVLIIIFRDI